MTKIEKVNWTNDILSETARFYEHLYKAPRKYDFDGDFNIFVHDINNPTFTETELKSLEGKI